LTRTARPVIIRPINTTHHATNGVATKEKG